MVGNKELGLGSQAHGADDQADVPAPSGKGGQGSRTNGVGNGGIECKEAKISSAAEETEEQEDLVLPDVSIQNLASNFQKYKSTKSSRKGLSKEKETKCK